MYQLRSLEPKENSTLYPSSVFRVAEIVHSGNPMVLAAKYPRPSAKIWELPRTPNSSTSAKHLPLLPVALLELIYLRNNGYPSPYSCPSEASHRLCCTLTLNPAYIHPPISPSRAQSLLSLNATKPLMMNRSNRASTRPKPPSKPPASKCP